MKLAQVKYRCKCGEITQVYVWDNEIAHKRVKCSCKAVMDGSNVVKPEKMQLTAIRTDTKNR